MSTKIEINAEANDIRTLSAEEMDHVSGGCFCLPRFPWLRPFPICFPSFNPVRTVVNAVSSVVRSVGNFFSSLF